jgi:excisionase family DNA binding protein
MSRYPGVRSRVDVESPPLERIAYSPGELAAALGVTRGHVQNMIARGELPSFKLGRLRLIPADVVHRLMGEAEASTDPAA